MFSQMFARAAYASVQYFITPITICNFSNRTRFQSCANRFVSAWSAVENRCIRSVHQNVLDDQCCENISTLVIWTKMMMFYNVMNSDYIVYVYAQVVLKCYVHLSAAPQSHEAC